MLWSDVVWRWLLCRQLYTMCISHSCTVSHSWHVPILQLPALARYTLYIIVCTAIIFILHQTTVSHSRNRVQNTYRMVSLHGAIVKITENRVIVNVYLQELCYLLFVLNLWGITVKCTVYVGSLYLYGGPTSVTETVRLIVLLLYSYTICCCGYF